MDVMMRVALLDDDPERLADWESSIRQGEPSAEVVSFTDSDLLGVVGELHARQTAEAEDSRLDAFDVVVADYDLRKGDVGLTTGADIARLARCYTRCGPIVLMNAFRGSSRERRFDLSLVGDLDYFSDVEIGSAFLGNRGLWTGDAESWPRYRPWNWPDLENLTWRLSSLADLLQEDLDCKVVEVIPGLLEHLEDLGREELVWLGTSPRRLRVRDLTPGPAGVETDAPLGPAGRDVVPEDIAGRFAAARLIKWLDQFVRTRQIALVDAPHLVARYPDLLNDQASYDELRRLDPLPAGLLAPALDELTADLGDWSSRPVWWATDVRRDPRLEEYVDPLKVGTSEIVFCEDLSSFVSRERAQDYSLDINSPYRRRWVADADSHDLSPRPDYQPKQWFAL